MWDLKACIVCFATGGNLTCLESGKTRQHFDLISGLQSCKVNGMPEYLCVVCLAFVKKFIKFREKCQRSFYTLTCMLDVNKEIKAKDLKTISSSSLAIKPALSYLDLDKTHYEQAHFLWTKDCRNNYVSNDVIPVAHCSTLTSEDTFENAMKDVSNDDPDADVKLEDHYVDDKLDVFDDKLPTLEDNDKMELEIELGQDDNFDNAVKEDTAQFDDDDFIEEDAATAIDGSTIDERYATLIPITVKEAKAVMEVKKQFMVGKFKCECGWSDNKEDNLARHQRLHSKHINGNFHCDICDFYYRTDFLLQTHMTLKHMYKYVCRVCCEVHFDKPTAKQHYILVHGVTSLKAIRKPKKRKTKKVTGYAKGYNKGVKNVPSKCLRFVAMKPAEQYQMIIDRKKTKNYLDSQYKCDFCYRGFRLYDTYAKHMIKHDTSISGPIMCDMCKLFFPDTRRLYKHMNMNHLTKYICKLCKFTTPNRNQAIMHYRWHENVTYDCPHCDRKFMKKSTCLTHVRLKHPSNYMCTICGHSFVSSHGLLMHKVISHKQDRDGDTVAKTADNHCQECDVTFLNHEAYVTHLSSSSKHVDINRAGLASEQTRKMAERGQRRARGRGRGRTEVLNNGLTTPSTCEICGITLTNDVQTKKHYETEHPGTDYLKRYMCDVCGHTTKQYANLLAHMRTHTNEKPYQCTFCDRRFSMPSNRDRHLVVHTGEKRYECQHCSRRFTQSSAVKLHIQTVHMKIPYAPWDKKKRKRRKEMEPNTNDMNVVAPQMQCVITQSQPQPKLLIDNQGDYINAYITYADE